MAKKLKEIDKKLIKCKECPRLVSWRNEVSITKRKAYLDENYWGKPVPGFGPSDAKLLIVGLAPGAHGANRLASNSLLEGLVFGARIAEDIAKNLQTWEDPITPDPIEILISPSVRGKLQRAMSRGAAVVRSEKSLKETLVTLERLKDASTI